MSRGYRFGVFATLWIFAAACHYVGVEMFGPAGALWDLAQPAINDGWIQVAWRERLYTVFAQYLPLLTIAFACLWLLFSEYEAQTVTRRVQR